MNGPVTVKEIRESPRSPGRYTVVLSSGQQCVVGVQALSDAGATRVGAVIEADRLLLLLHAGAVTALVDRAIGFLARGRRSRRELEIRLGRTKPGVEAPPRALIAEALDRLESSGVLSDEAVAKAEAASRLRRGEAPGRVRQMLRRKGIDGPQTESALNEAVEADGFDEVDACRAQAQKRWRALASLEPAVAKRRLIAFLQRRGFGGRAIHIVVNDVVRGTLDDD